jgi:hypothetical protein
MKRKEECVLGGTVADNCLSNFLLTFPPENPLSPSWERVGVRGIEAEKHEI